MFSFLPLRILKFSCYIEVSLDFKLELIKKKKSKDFSEHIVSDGQIRLILKHKCTFIWCSYHFNRPFCAILQYPRSNKYSLSKRKAILSQAAGYFFRILCRMNIYFKRVIIYQTGITMNISKTPANICWSSRRLEDVFKACLEDVFNTSSA